MSHQSENEPYIFRHNTSFLSSLTHL